MAPADQPCSAGDHTERGSRAVLANLGDLRSASNRSSPLQASAPATADSRVAPHEDCKAKRKPLEIRRRSRRPAMACFGSCHHGPESFRPNRFSKVIGPATKPDAIMPACKVLTATTFIFIG